MAQYFPSAMADDSTGATQPSAHPEATTGTHGGVEPIQFGLIIGSGHMTCGSGGTVLNLKQKKEIAESIEDARIWASDMSPINGGINQNHYEKINMRNLNQQYESIKNMQVQVR